MQTVTSESFNVTTLLGSELGLATLLPVNFPLHREFTINQHLNIQPLTDFRSLPKLQYFGLGLKGAYNSDDENGRTAYAPNRLNMNLYHPIPIRCRPIDEDLSDAERVNYRLRQRVTLRDGNEYFLYWLKTMEFDTDIKFKRINPLTGAEEAFELSSEYLEPTPEKTDASQTTIANSSSVVAYCNARIEASAKEVLEYIRVEFEGDVRKSFPTEIGFFTGVDVTVEGVTGQNVAVTYTEALYTMLYHHCTWLGSSLTHEGQNIDTIFEITSNGTITEA